MGFDGVPGVSHCAITGHLRVPRSVIVRLMVGALPEVGMWRMLRRGLRAHPGQAAVLGLLALVLAAVAVAAPAYSRSASRDLRSAQLEAAAAVDRVLSVQADIAVDTSGDRGKVDAAVDATARSARAAGLVALLTLQLPVTLVHNGQSAAVSVMSRTGACERLLVEGRCPEASGEVLVGRAAAAAVGLRVGDPVRADLRGTGGSVAFRLVVVGVYTVGDAHRGYWSTRRDLAPGPQRTDTPLIAAEQTLRALAATDPGLADPGVDQRLPVTNAAALTTVIDLLALDPATLPADVGAARAELEGLRRVPPEGFTASGRLPELLDRIGRGERGLAAGIAATAAGLLLTGGFVLLLAAGLAAGRRAPHTTLAVLRGAPAISRWWFAAAPGVLVTAAGASAGAVLGRILAAGLPSSADVAAGAAVVAVLTAGVLAMEMRPLRLPVPVALRQAQPAARRLRVGAFELILAAAAVLGAVQLAIGTPDEGIAPLAPPVIVLAAALLAGRGLAALAAVVSTQRLRRGDLRTGLAAAHLSRRPHTARLFALLVVAVALLGLAVAGYDTTRSAVRDRAAVELGAARVLSVAGATPGGVRAAVHAADPQGRWLLAAARDGLGASAVVAVESDRLVRVTGWDDQAAHRLASLLRPAVSSPVRVTGVTVVIDVLLDRAEAATTIRAGLVTDGGDPFVVEAKPPAEAGAHQLGLATPKCTGGCRLAWLGFSSSPDGLWITRVGQRGPDATVVDAAALGTPGRWRSGFTTSPGELTVVPSPAGLSARYVPSDPRAMSTDLRVLVADTPVPLPVVAAGPARIAQTDEVRVLPALTAGFRPVRVTASTGVLPGAGADGFLVDHEYADRLSDARGGDARQEVWARADTPPQVLAAVRGRLSVTGEETVESRAARMARAGAAQAAQVRLAAAGLGVLLAAAGLAVAALAEHRSRLAELRDLRRQGLDAATAAGSALRSYAGLVLGGIGAGALLAAAVSIALIRVGIPVFTDGWTATRAPVLPRPLVALAAFAVAAAMIGAVGIAASRRLAADLRREA